MLPKAFKERVRLRQIFTVGAIPLEQVWHSIQPESVNPHLAPVVDHFEDFLLHSGIIIVEVGLMMKESVPEILLGYGVPCPVGRFEILEDDTGITVLVRVVCP